MTEAFGHLSDEARKLLSAPRAERIARVNRGWWIGYERAHFVLSKLESLLAHPRVARMPSTVLVGAPNNGKTRILQRFQKKHPPVAGIDGRLEVPVLCIQAPKTPDERRFYVAIIEAFGLPYRPNDHLSKLEYKAFQLLLDYKVKLLLIDDFNDLSCGSAMAQREFLNLLKGVTNRLQISIVGAGTRPAIQLMQLDHQFSSRFKPVHLPNWEMGPAWRALLATFDQMLPFPVASNLQDESFARVLLAQSEHTIGDLWDLLKECAEYAILKSETCIKPSMIASIGWVKPSERTRSADLLSA